jgi:hypothetical protein
MLTLVGERRPPAAEPLTADELAAVARRHAQATPGPWRWDDISPAPNDYPILLPRRLEDAEFVGTAWVDVQRLLATVRAQQEEIARLRKAASFAEGDPDSCVSHDGEHDGVTTAIRAHAHILRHDLAALDEALDQGTLPDVQGAELIVRLARAGVTVRQATDLLTAPKLRRSVRRDKRGART